MMLSALALMSNKNNKNINKIFRCSQAVIKHRACSSVFMYAILENTIQPGNTYAMISPYTRGNVSVQTKSSKK